MSSKRIIVNKDRCMGCMSCMNICSFIHEGEFNLSKARLIIYMEPFTGEVEGYPLESCDQCKGSPECVRWCPVGALRYSNL